MSLFAVCCTAPISSEILNALLNESQAGALRLYDNAEPCLVIIRNISSNEKPEASRPPIASIEQPPFEGTSISEIPSILQSLLNDYPDAELSSRHFAVLDEQTVEDGSTALLVKSRRGTISATVRARFNAIQHALEASDIGASDLGELSIAAEKTGGVYDPNYDGPKRGQPAPRKQL